MMFVQVGSMLFATLLFAHTQTPGQTPPPKAPPAPGTNAPSNPGGQPATGSNRATDRGLAVQRSDRLLGMKVYDKTQTQLGAIDDIVLRPNGEIAYGVLSGSDGSDQGKLWVVPWNTLNVQSAHDDPSGKPMVGAGKEPRPDQVNLSVDKDRLHAGPNFDRSAWATTTNKRELFDQADAYYAAGDLAQGGRRGDTTTGRPIEAGATNGFSSLRGSQLKNQLVVDATGNPVGNIGPVVFDPSGARINYVALTLTSPTANGTRTIAVPWQVLRVTRDGDKPQQFTISTPVETLQAAPEFQTGDSSWKQMSDPKWINDLYGHYSVRPYWNAERAGGLDKNKSGGPSSPDSPR